MTAYYNEIGASAAQALRKLISAGAIAPGDVDERSIEDVTAADLQGYTQCHFFAGIGVWSYALRLAGWPDDRPVWTGSCPCQPFSAAGKGAGFADERHLWPAFHHLIQECKPSVVFGEQVASKSVGPWIDLVHADLDALDYAYGCLPFPSAGVGAPHIRDRAYWVAYTSGARLEERVGRVQREAILTPARQALECDGDFGGLGNAQGKRFTEAGKPSAGPEKRLTDAGAALGRLADSSISGRREERADGSAVEILRKGPVPRSLPSSADRGTGPTNGFWRDADWLGCTDGKWRPVEPGTQPLAHGAPNRVGRLHGLGNAINAEAARIFIKSVMEIL